MSEVLKVLIVDDSITYRAILTSVLHSIPEVSVVGTASNGKSALVKLSQVEVDMVLLDIEMPEMDGLQALHQISKVHPQLGAIMVSGTNRHSADITIQALEAGALDFVSKPDMNSVDENIDILKNKLLPIFKQFLVSRSQRNKATPIAISKVSLPAPVIQPISASPLTQSQLEQVDIIVIGVSTGGPNALNELIPRLPSEIGVPILLVQHMPPMFTASLAYSLNNKSALTVKEAEDGEFVKPNTVYIAPGGFHMETLANRRGHVIIRLNEGPQENSCRPAIDVLFRSVAKTYEKNILALIMTGMGNDGARGVKAIKGNSNCYCITQTENSCVIYGMPKAVDQLNLSDEQVDLSNLAERITVLTKNKVSR